MTVPNVLVVHPSLPVRSVKALIALGKSRRGEGAQIVAGSPEQFAAYLRSETEKWVRVVKAARIPLQ